MITVFHSILPIFLLIVAGNLLRRTTVIDPGAWVGLEQLGFWFLYPVLLFTTIYNADFSGLSLDTLILILFASIAVLTAMLAGFWLVSRKTGLIARTEFSSVFQTSVRWNGFMAFAIAQKLFPPEGMAFVALMMAAIIIPINLQSVYVLALFAPQETNWKRILFKIATNPLILASLAALIFRFMPFGLYPPFGQALDLIGRAALGMGLVAIGAGLRPGDLLTFRPAIWVPVTLKLLVFPAIVVTFAVIFNITGAQLSYLVLCASVPTAMNGFLLARQMGGDAELYAAITTMQTVVSFFTIPMLLAFSGYIPAG